MAIPFIMAGPILRRVEPGSVSVWLALSEPARVTLKVYEGVVDATDPPGDALLRGQSEEAGTLRVGRHLHILVVTADRRRLLPEEEPPMALTSGTLYSYDLEIGREGGAAEGLLQSGLLGTDTRNGHPHLPIGYAPDILPGFSLPPQDLENLRILHGSCRKPHGPGRDALAYADDMIADTRLDADRRPHLLFLTGDQIYADDVALPLLPKFTALDGELLEGTPEEVPITTGANPARIRVDQAHLPAGFRQAFINGSAGFTSGSASCHLVSFGEYAAHYLFSWCIEVWPTDLDDLMTFDVPLAAINPDAPAFAKAAPVLFGAMGKDLSDSQRTQFLQHFFKLGATSSGSGSKLAKVLDTIDTSWLKPENAKKKLQKADIEDDLKPTLQFAAGLAEAESEKFRGFFADLKKALAGKVRASAIHKERLAEFYRTLPKVRRLLANVPTYMIWDDHDVTDDWNLSGHWVAQVAASACGRDIVRNGMAAFALFQDWGNRPGDYADGGAKAAVRDNLRQLFDPQAGPWPAQTPANNLTTLFERGGDNALPWHYAFGGVDFRGLVLNTRTERGFDSPLSAPNLVPLISDAGPLGRQVPLEPQIQDDQVLIVVSAVPVLGLPVMEQIGQTVAVAALDFYNVAKHGKREAATTVDVEAWALHREGFEDLLLRLAPNRRIVFLSGDVHYGAAARLDHWRREVPDASHFVQFTSSPSKNAWPAPMVMAMERFGFAHRMLELHKTVERMGWQRRDPQPVAIAPDAELPIALLLLTEREPVLLPVYREHESWQGLSSTREADLRWRFNLLRDERPDADRPDATRPLPLPSGELSDTDPRRTYREVLSRHGDFIHKRAFTRSTLWVNNLGRVRFENRVQNFDAIQELWAANPAETETAPAEIMTEYRAPLRPIFPDPPPKLPGDP